MKRFAALFLIAFAPLACQADDSGLAERTSPYPVTETLDRLETLLNGKGIKVFARIDHAGAAESINLPLKPMQLLIFGHPKAGTPLMQAAPTAGLDLPMKVLAWQDDAGQVHVTWNSPQYLTARHGLDATYEKNLAAIPGLIDAALK